MITMTQDCSDIATRKQPFALARFSRIKTALLPALAGCLGLVASTLSHAAAIPIPNGDFSSIANAGTIGGGLVGLGATGSNVAIGAGPWTGSYFGVASLLLPPSLTIDSASQTATISGLLGVNGLSIVNNGGHFDQALATNFQPTSRYTLSANLSSSVPLDLTLLGATNAGIALIEGGMVVADTTTSPTALLRLDQLGPTTVRLSLTYDSTVTANGPIGVQLYNLPQGVLTAGLLSSASFASVQLAQSAITQPGTTLTVSEPNPRSAQVNTVFASSLVAHVTDINNAPVANAMVTLTAPASGASAALTSGSTTDRIVVAFTDAAGNASVSAAANASSGCYRVTASALGIADVYFNLRNYSAVGTPQDSIYCDGFE